jgi:hypothetical protein
MMKQKGYNWDNSRSTVVKFEKFLLDSQKEIIKQMEDEVGAMIAMQTTDDQNKPALGQISNSDGGFGDKNWFAVDYGAGGGWRIGNLSTVNGKWNTSGNATANNFTYWSGDYAYASVYLFNNQLEIFNAGMSIALTDGAVENLQHAPNSDDAQYQQPFVKGIDDEFKNVQGKAAAKDKDRIVQGHMHFRVAGDDILFKPVDKAVVPQTYASTEPLYSFEPASYDKTLFDESTTVVIVFVPVTIRGWATFHAGINYSISSALDRPHIDSLSHADKTNPNPFKLNNHIEPYAEVDGNVSVAVGVPGFEIGLKGTLQLIRLGLPYDANASVSYYDAQKDNKKSAGNRFYGNQQLNFTLSTLSGEIDGFIQVLFWEADAELFGWNGLTSTVPIFNLQQADANVHASTMAAQLLAGGK